MTSNSNLASTDGHQLARSPASSNSPNFQFERPDWALFRQVDTLGQKAGVPKDRLRRLVLKELADNALDTGANVTCGKLEGGGHYVQDDGPGIPIDTVAKLFSINRPLISSKLLRLPTRGALGNGLRVVAGAVAASDGQLRILTGNQRLTLKPEANGSTSVVADKIDFRVGTRVEVRFGHALPADDDALHWARIAIAMRGGDPYRGRSSPHWYDAASFHEMLLAAGDRYVRDLVAVLDGCTGGTAGRVTGELKGRMCSSVTKGEATALLARARAIARPVAPRRLGAVGPDIFTGTYCRRETVVDITGAKVPAVVEVWALARKGERSSALFGINRTPITGDISIWREKKEIAVYGCGLDRLIDVGGKSNLSVVVSVIAPFIPITTDGKEPDLSAFEETIAEAITKAARAALRNCGSDKPAEKRSHKYVVLDRLTEAISAVSGNGAHEFNLRQLFYHLRPFVNDEAGSELKYANFTQIITEYEAGNGEIEGMLRDARGVLYHPHLRQEIPLGTRAVKNYERPSWTFNKIIYLEKEGFFEVLKAARWPERNDCALLTSKGQATRAVKDLIDLLPDGGEPITVFCIHDADAAGTIIFEALQEETAARPRRRVEIVNLGLEPWEAVTMGLEIEEFDPSGRRPVAQYVKDRAEDTNWAEWLQTQRVELNAMTTPQFLAWLDDKLAPYDDGKVMPPDDVMAHRLRERVEQTIEAAIVAEVLAAANIDELVAQAITGIAWPDVDEVVEIVEAGFDTEPELRWSDWIDGTAKQLVEDR